MRPVTNWEPMFDALVSGAIFPAANAHRIRRLVNWPAVVREWRAELPQLHAGVPMLVGWYFDMEMRLEVGGGYQMVWDVPKAQALLRKHHIQQGRWPASMLNPHSAP